MLDGRLVNFGVEHGALDVAVAEHLTRHAKRHPRPHKLH